MDLAKPFFQLAPVMSGQCADRTFEGAIRKRNVLRCSDTPSDLSLFFHRLIQHGP